MTEIINIVILLVQVGIGAMIFYYKNKVKGYANQLGKDLAKKENLEELTNIVEEVKQKFTFIQNRQKIKLTILQEERLNAIKEVYPLLVKFSNDLENFSRTPFGHEEKEKFINEESSIGKKLDELHLKLKTKRIVFEGETLKHFDKIIKVMSDGVRKTSTMKQSYINYDTRRDQGDITNAEVHWENAIKKEEGVWDTVMKHIPELLEILENDFRNILAVDSFDSSQTLKLP